MGRGWANANFKTGAVIQGEPVPRVDAERRAFLRGGEDAGWTVVRPDVAVLVRAAYLSGRASNEQPYS